MIYSEETKKELDSILKAFEGYIDGQNFFDLICPQKSNPFPSGRFTSSTIRS